MKANKEETELIQVKFSEMETLDDLLEVLNISRRIIYQDDSNPFRLKFLTYNAFPKNNKNRYTSFEVSKKSGGVRNIHAPTKGLKSILKALNFTLQCVYKPNYNATGFIQGKSIVDNAKIHANNHYVLNLDLENFFHSFDRKWVKYGFMLLLGKEKEELAFALACLCTHNIIIDDENKYVLPQGSPTSPIISNILCERLDRRLNGLAKSYGAKYTRYADDITFSGNYFFYKKKFKKELKRIIENDQKLKINPTKTRLQQSNHRQEVTGLVVNEKVNVKRRYVKDLRMWLYYWERYGYDKAKEVFAIDYLDDRGYKVEDNPELKLAVSGKLEFLKMVKGKNDSTYKKLNQRFVKLTKKPSEKKLPEVGIEIDDIKVSPSTASNESEKLVLPNKYIPPANLTRFLTAYNQDPVLKYTCHEIDDNIVLDAINKICQTTEYNLVKHQKAISNAFKKITNEYQVNKNLWGLINAYLNGGERWSSDNIEVNWNSKDLITWSKQYPKLVPNPGDNLKNKNKDSGYRLPKPFNSIITGGRVTTFSKLVIHFKHLFHLRADNSLKDVLKRVNEKENFNEKIVFEFDRKYFRSNLELFTDVDKLTQAYRSIIKKIIEVSKDKPLVRLSFREEGENTVILSIHHLNTTYGKTLQNTIDRPGEDQTKMINNLINGLCDLYLKADFDQEEYALVNLWDQRKGHYEAERIGKFEGVEFIMKFRK